MYNTYMKSFKRGGEMSEKMKKMTASDFKSGKTEKFSTKFANTELSVSVEMYFDLGNYFVECLNEADKENNHTYSFGTLSQARAVFNDKVKMAKHVINMGVKK